MSLGGSKIPSQAKSLSERRAAGSMHGAWLVLTVGLVVQLAAEELLVVRSLAEHLERHDVRGVSLAGLLRFPAALHPDGHPQLQQERPPLGVGLQGGPMLSDGVAGRPALGGGRYTWERSQPCPLGQQGGLLGGEGGVVEVQLAEVARI